MLLPSLLAKIDEIEAYCLAQIPTSCSNFNGEDCTAGTTAAYNTALSLLRTAVAAYYTTEHNVGRYTQLNTLIMTIYQTLVMENLTISGDGLVTVDELTAPNGYTDFRLLFDMGQAGVDLLAMPVESFWDGCVPSSVSDITTHLIMLYTHIASCSNAEQVDATARTALIHWLQLTNMQNSYMFLFEEVVVTDNRPSNQKESLGVSIFTDRHAAEIINYFNLGIRVPSYI